MAQPPPLVGVPRFALWPGVGPIADGDVATAEAVLAAASARARTVAGRSWLTAEGDLEEVPEDVVDVVVQAAARVWTNPEGYLSETTGPFTGRRSDRAGEGLYFTTEETAVLTRYSLTTRPGLYTQPTTRLTQQDHTGWVPVEGALYPFPWY